MILFELSVLCVTYIGVRLVENFQAPPKTRRSIAQPEGALMVKPSQVEKYFTISAVSIGLTVLRQLNQPLYFLSLGSIVYTSIPILKHGEKQIRDRKIGHDLLFSLLIPLCLATGQLVASAIGIFLYHTGLRVLAKTQQQSEKMLANLFKQQPSHAWVLKGDVEVEVPLADVRVDDIVVVNTGEVIPIDGIIVDGVATIDQQVLTGEAMPVEKEIGESVLASTLVVSGLIKIKVERTGFETTIHQIGEILTRTTNFKTFTQLKGEQWADNIAPPLLGLGALALYPLGVLGATTVINSGFGNRIRVLAPLGTLSYLNQALRQGILIKDGGALEGLKKVDTILFDKTGTLTTNSPKVGKIICCDGYQTNQILKYAAAAENRLAHPIAVAIINKAKAADLYLPEVEDSKYQMGLGVTVNIEGKLIQVGSVRFMITQGLMLPDNIEKAQADSHRQGYSLVIVAIDQQVAGAIEIQPTLRPEVAAVMTGLRMRGIEHLAIVSGDQQQPTKQLAYQLGMDSYFYEVLPQQKAEIVERLQRQGKTVCFVGDGINDAIAMKKADVSVSLHGASDVATDVAQVVLMDGTLSHLTHLFDISIHLEINLVRTLAIIVVTSATNLTGAFLFHLSVMSSMVLSYAGFLVALKNATRPIKKPKD
jgi:heavy metal translocating P-type ATPase